MVLLLSPAQQQIAAEQPVAVGHWPILADCTVEADRPRRQQLASDAPGVRQAALHQQGHQIRFPLDGTARQAILGQLGQIALAKASHLATEQQLADAPRRRQRPLAVHQLGQLVRQHLLGQLAPLPLGILHFQRLNLGQRHKAVVAQEAVDILVRGAEPELVEGVGRGERRIEPDCAPLGLAKLGAIGLGDERQGHAIDLGLIEPAGEVHAAGDVAPLVVATYLQGAAEALVEHREVLGLQQGVGELGKRDALIRAGEALAHRLAGQHGVDREVLADVPQKIEGGHLPHPVGVVDQQRRRQPFARRQQRFYLGRQAGHPALHRLGAVEAALARLEAGIADKTGGPAHQGHRGVARQLEAAQHQQRHQMADMQAAGGGIEAAVDGARAG